MEENNKKIKILISLAIIVIFVALIFKLTRSPREVVIDPNPGEVIDNPLPDPTVLSYGSVNLGINEVAVFEKITIKPLAILEDSRCPVGVNCIWAGRIRLQIEIIKNEETTLENLELNSSAVTAHELITLIAVAPTAKEGQKINPEDYRFDIKVELKKEENPKPVTSTPNPPIKPAPKACVKGGCSGQICSDNPDLITTCEYREVYACYQTAKCERQASGECGWTETAELKMCIDNKS